MTTVSRPPWHLWFFASISALWFVFVAYGYVMTEIENPAFISRFPPDLMQLLETMPSWALAARTCGIWVGPVAALLLFIRSRHAFWAFLIVLSALSIGTLGEQWIGLPDTMKSQGMFALKGINWGLLITMVAYTHLMQSRGVLR